MNLRPIISLLLLLAGSLWLPTFAAENGAGLDALRKLPMENCVVEAVDFIADGVYKINNQEFKDFPPFVVVKLKLSPAAGSNIGVEIWLPTPENWNGKLLGIGNGGSAGSIPTGSFIGPIKVGYAAASTDMGTAPNDRSGINNPEVWKDFGYRATHLMTVAAKLAIKIYYGREPDLSYFNGKSTGGQQALQEAQRYPEDYDGIAADVPAHCRTPLHAYFLWNYQILKRCPFTAEQERNVMDAGIKYLAPRQLPPLAGRAIADPRATPDDIAAVIKLARSQDASLTDDHAEALRLLYQGPRNSATGEVIFDGVPLGAGFRIATGHLYLFAWVFGNEKKFEDLNFNEDLDAYTAALGPWLNAENVDLRAFAERGGKLVMASGSADGTVPYTATLDYYDRVIDHFGSLEKVQSFFRYYIFAGAEHGWTGSGINQIPAGLLDLVVNWRENGIAPDGFIGRRFENGKRIFEVPVFPYPTRSVYDATHKKYTQEIGPRGGVARAAERFSPPAQE